MAKNKNKRHRLIVYTRDNFTCKHCNKVFDRPDKWDQVSAIHDGKMFLEIDHIVPLSKGGSDEVTNKQSLCQKCNNKKSNKV